MLQIFFIDSGFWDALPVLLLVVLLADIGIAVVGALFIDRVNTRARDLLLPLLLLPRGAGADCRRGDHRPAAHNTD